MFLSMLFTIGFINYELLGSLGTVLAGHVAINESFWVVLECDSLIQFIDSIIDAIRRFDSFIG